MKIYDGTKYRDMTSEELSQMQKEHRTVNPVYNALSELVGLYVEAV